MRRVCVALSLSLCIHSTVAVGDTGSRDPSVNLSVRTVADLSLMRKLIEGKMSPPTIALNDGMVMHLRYNSDGRLASLMPAGSSRIFQILYSQESGLMKELRVADASTGETIDSYKLPPPSHSCGSERRTGKNVSKLLSPEEEEEQWARDFLSSMENSLDPWRFGLDWDYLGWAQRDDKERIRCVSDCQNQCDIAAVGVAAICGLTTAILAGAGQGVGAAIVAGGCAVGVPIWRYSCRDHCTERCR